jgi:hypothetical protein
MTRQLGWASCPNCQGFHFAGFPDFKGVCPAGGAHQQRDSFAYEIDLDVPAGPNIQLGWASCPRCQGLHFAGFPDFKGVCPSGGPHQQSGSFAYALRFDVPAPQGSQSEWRSCPKCLGLFFGPYQGRCPAGDHHSSDRSFNYVVIGSHRPFITLEIVEGPFARVDGFGFTPNASVVLYYQFKSATTFDSGDESLVSDLNGTINNYRIRVNLTGQISANVRAHDAVTNQDAIA